jgi:hypothetical protein
MTTLATSAAGEVCLTLRGATENRVLTTLRRWPHWNRLEVERDPTDADRYLSVTLVTDQVHEPTLREILRRSFGLTFPVEGGSSDVAVEPPVKERRRRW